MTDTPDPTAVSPGGAASLADRGGDVCHPTDADMANLAEREAMERAGDMLVDVCTLPPGIAPPVTEALKAWQEARNG